MIEYSSYFNKNGEGNGESLAHTRASVGWSSKILHNGFIVILVHNIKYPFKS